MGTGSSIQKIAAIKKILRATCPASERPGIFRKNGMTKPITPIKIEMVCLGKAFMDTILNT